MGSHLILADLEMDGIAGLPDARQLVHVSGGATLHSKRVFLCQSTTNLLPPPSGLGVESERVVQALAGTEYALHAVARPSPRFSRSN